MQADTKRVRTGPEILAIEVTMDNIKFVFRTVFNLGEPSHASIMNTFKLETGIRSMHKNT